MSKRNTQVFLNKAKKLLDDNLREESFNATVHVMAISIESFSSGALKLSSTDSYDSQEIFKLFKSAIDRHRSLKKVTSDKQLTELIRSKDLSGSRYLFKKNDSVWFLVTNTYASMKSLLASIRKSALNEATSSGRLDLGQYFDKDMMDVGHVATGQFAEKNAPGAAKAAAILAAVERFGAANTPGALAKIANLKASMDRVHEAHGEVTLGLSASKESSPLRGVKGRFIFTVPQSSYVNRKTIAPIEAGLVRAAKALISSIEKDLDQIVSLKGSPSILDQVEGVLVSGVTKKRAKNVRTKIPNRDAKTGRFVSSAQSVEKKRKDKKGIKVVPATIAGVSGSRKKAKKSAFSITRYLALFNERIGSVVRKNMVLPGLRNRTGRFASSVRVTDVSQTAQGFPSIGYTYQTSPYQTFEVGFAQGTTERDPRRLIDRSIREIAIEYGMGRIYTRRV